MNSLVRQRRERLTWFDCNMTCKLPVETKLLENETNTYK